MWLSFWNSFFGRTPWWNTNYPRIFSYHSHSYHSCDQCKRFSNLLCITSSLLPFHVIVLPHPHCWSGFFCGPGTASAEQRQFASRRYFYPRYLNAGYFYEVPEEHWDILLASAWYPSCPDKNGNVYVWVVKALYIRQFIQTNQDGVYMCIQHTQQFEVPSQTRHIIKISSTP